MKLRKRKEAHQDPLIHLANTSKNNSKAHSQADTVRVYRHSIVYTITSMYTSILDHKYGKIPWESALGPTDM